MSGELFKKYHKRLKKEGILKALLCGLIVGFSVLAVLAALFWFMGWDHFWISLIAWGVASVGATIAFYKYKYQPTTKAIALRVDKLGLEERILTMTELEGDTSYIATRQREDALKALGTVQASLIKLIVSLPVIIAAAACAFVAAGTTTLSVLTSLGILPSGLELMQIMSSDGKYGKYEIVYEIQEGEGMLVGELTQEIQHGEEGTAVVAIPSEEWVFIGWSDGLQNPYRKETNVQSDKTIRAIFLPMDEIDDGENDAEDDDMPQGEPNPDAPKEERPIPMPNSSQKYEEVNQVINGNTYYGEVYGDAAENSREEVANGEYSDAQKEMTNGYLDGIETIVGKEEGGN